MDGIAYSHKPVDIDPQAWWEKAACLGMAPMFDADTYDNSPYSTNLGVAKSVANMVARITQERKKYRPQLQVCASCPVRRACTKDTVERERRATHTRAGRSPWTSTVCISGGYLPTERLLWHLNNAYPHQTPLGAVARSALSQLTPRKETIRK